MSITEDDVCRAHEKLVKSIAYKARGIDRDDAIAIARIGLLDAIRKWRPGAIPFDDYAKQRMCEHIESYKKELSAQKRAEAIFSIDEWVGSWERPVPRDELIAIEEMEQSTIDLALFIRGLEPVMRKFIYMRLKGYSNQRIARLMGMTKNDVAEIHNRVMNILTQYFERPRD